MASQISSPKSQNGRQYETLNWAASLGDSWIYQHATTYTKLCLTE